MKGLFKVIAEFGVEVKGLYIIVIPYPLILTNGNHFYYVYSTSIYLFRAGQEWLTQVLITPLYAKKVTVLGVEELNSITFSCTLPLFPRLQTPNYIPYRKTGA